MVGQDTRTMLPYATAAFTSPKPYSEKVREAPALAVIRRCIGADPRPAAGGGGLGPL